MVESILLYNCSTWALSEGEANKLDVFQRKLIRQVLGYKWSDKISNNDLYAEAGLEAASIQVVKARWMLFGHTLRLHEHTPARLAMLSYFNNANDDKIRLGRPAVTIATCLSNEYMKCTGDKINNIDHYNMVLHKAQDKIVWRQIVDDVVNVHKKALMEKKEKQSKKRKGCDVTVVIRGSECHYNLRKATKLCSGNECQNGGSFSAPFESEDVVGHNRSAVVVESDVVMSKNVDSYKIVKRRRIHNHMTNSNKDSQ